MNLIPWSVNVVSVCLSVNVFSLTNKSPSSTVILSRVSSILFNSVCEFILLEAVIRRPSILPKKSLWSGSNTLPSTLRPEGALADFMANSTLGVTKFFIAVNTVSWTLISTEVITLSTSLPTLLIILSSSVCTINLSWVAYIVRRSTSTYHVISFFDLLILIALPNHKMSAVFTQLAKKPLFCCFFLSGRNHFNVNNWINQWFFLIN